MSYISKLLSSEFKIDTKNNERTEPRYKTRELAYLEVYGHTGKIFCKLENLSLSGASLSIVSSDFVPTAGDISKITVHLRSLKKTHIKPVEVVWSKNMSLGIRFIDRSEVQKRLNNQRVL